jgi:hypothetical protein
MHSDEKVNVKDKIVTVQGFENPQLQLDQTTFLHLLGEQPREQKISDLRI